MSEAPQEPNTKLNDMQNGWRVMAEAQSAVITLTAAFTAAVFTPVLAIKAAASSSLLLGGGAALCAIFAVGAFVGAVRQFKTLMHDSQNQMAQHHSAEDGPEPPSQ